MSKKSGRIAELIEGCRGQGWNPYYLGYFECFNRGLYFEAHDVLEELWLQDRQSPNYGFYKGLIQFAGAFVHLQKQRLRPASALFQLARANFLRYPALHDDLDLAAVLRSIDQWQARLEEGRFEVNPLNPSTAPELRLASQDGSSRGAASSGAGMGGG